MLTVVVLTTALAACGSTGHSASNGRSPSPAAVTPGSSSPAAGGSASSASRLVRQFETRPTSIGTTTKLKGNVPSNVTIAYPECGAAGCTAGANAFAEAAGIFGWKLEPIVTTGTSASVDAAWSQIVREKPTVAVLAGTPYAQVASYVNAASAEGVYVVGGAITGTASPTGPIKYIEGGSVQTGEQGVPLAAWIAYDAAKSGLRDPGVLYVNVPDFTILSSVETYFTRELDKLAPGDNVTVLNIGLASLDQAASQVLTDLRAHPSIKYLVYSAANLFDSVTPAVNSAGLGVKILGTDPDPTSLSYLKSGEMSAAVAYPIYEGTYATINHLAWYFADPQSSEAKATAPPNSEIPDWLITQSDVPAVVAATQAFPIVANVAAQWAALWGRPCSGTYVCASS